MAAENAQLRLRTETELGRAALDDLLRRMAGGAQARPAPGRPARGAGRRAAPGSQACGAALGCRGGWARHILLAADGNF
jgi:hypothetical protein